ncbi:MAG: HAD family hydrolase [Nanoarchaeota archaeon]
MVKLIIFDWDDVFTKGSIKGYFNCYEKTLNSLGKTFGIKEKDIVLKNWGKQSKIVFSELLEDTSEKIEYAIKIYESDLLTDTFLSCINIIEGSKELIIRLNKEYKLAIATGINPIVLQRIFLKFNFPNLFSQIVSVYDIGKGKPDPYMLNLILKTQNIKKEEAIIVGDATNDMIMGQNAGILSVAVLTGHLNKKQAEELGIKYIIENVTQLESVLEKL